MSAYVVDTNAVVHFAANRMSKLGKAARRVFEAYEAGQATLYVPAPVAMELWMLALGGTIRTELGFARWWAQLRTTGFVAVELSGDDVAAAANLSWRHRDIFDRLIVVTALRLDCPLVTGDREITEWGGVDVVW